MEPPGIHGCSGVQGFYLYEDLAWSTAGYAYQRVFEGTRAELSWYFDSSLLALNTGYTGSPSSTD